MLTQLTLNWWAVALRGVIAILFGGITFGLSGLMFEILVLIIGGYTILFGAMLLGLGLRLRKHGTQLLWIKTGC
jgi:uncharacterized membrane protein HdeD (DUF308 family)